jgi:hypothetical protein
MSFESFDIVVKLYVNPVLLPLTTTTLHFESGDYIDYNDIWFKALNGQKRLVRVSAQLSPLANGILVGNIQNDNINPTWSFYGPFKNGKNSFNDYMRNIPAPISEEAGAPPTVALFEIPYPRLYMSSENPVYDPICQYCEGWGLDQVFVYLGAPITITNTYWGRIRMQFIFDLDS